MRFSEVPKPGWWPLRGLQGLYIIWPLQNEARQVTPYLSSLSTAVINTVAKSYTGRKGLFGLLIVITVHHKGKGGQELKPSLEAGADDEAVEECC